MPEKPDNERDSSGESRKPSQSSQPQGERKQKGRTITTKDAGWITPTAFVAPISLIPLDPPRPIKKRRK